MAGESNVVEIRLRAVDEFTRAFGGLNRAIGGLRGLAGLFGGALSIGALVRNITEAEDAVVQLDAAFKATGRTLGRSRDELEALSNEIQRTTTFSDDLTNEAQSILLTFDKVRGDAFERTILAATDLAARFKTDLPSAVRQLGRALQDPERGLQALTRAGVTFSGAQREQIKNLVESGKAFEAQNLIVAEVERRFAGAAEAARGTLGGALKGLSNTVSDLFEGDRGGISGLTGAVNELSETLADPRVKEGFDAIIAALTQIAGAGVQAVSVLARLATGLASLLSQTGGEIRSWYDDLPRPIREALEAGGLAALRQLSPAFGLLIDASARQPDLPGLPSPRRGGARPGRSTGDDDTFAGLDEIEVRVRRLPETVGDPVADLLSDMERRTQTSLQRQLADWAEFEADLKVLVASGTITAADAAARSAERLEEELGEIEVQVRRLPPVVSEQMSAASEAALEATRDIQGAFADAFANIGNGFDDFGDSIANAFKRLFANIAANAIVELLGIEKLLKDMAKQFSSSGSSSSGGGGALQALGSLFAGFFTGGSAAGGLASGLQVVGEDGPEVLDVGRGKVHNRRQLAFAGMGGRSVSIENKVNVVIEAKDSDAPTLRTEFAFAMNHALQRNNEQMSELLYRNGFGRLR